MDLKSMDIVYFVKASSQNEELRYSLRSVEQNFPHRNVWFIGGCPEGLHPDRQLEVSQNEKTKWENTSKSFKAACENNDISDNFVLFNDDFFVMKPVEFLPYYSDGIIESRIQQLRRHHMHDTLYSSRLMSTVNLLKNAGLPTVSYAVHFPMVINKHEMLQTFEAFPDGLMWRSIYGNHHHKPAIKVFDCKINDIRKQPDSNWTFLSTQDLTFRSGCVGSYIRKIFTEPSKFEK